MVTMARVAVSVVVDQAMIVVVLVVIFGDFW
jgi:hypothetical protein